jgi:dimethylargininase
MLVALTNAVSPWLVEEYPFVDFELALLQQDAYCKKLADHGVNVEQLKVNCACPNGCFIEDTAIVDELAIIAPMGIDSRRNEPESIESELAKYRRIEHVSPEANVEGGDILQVGRDIFVGLSSSTNACAVDEFERILGPFGYSMIPVNVTGGLHLKSACTALNDETLLVKAGWIPSLSKHGECFTCPKLSLWQQTQYVLAIRSSCRMAFRELLSSCKGTFTKLRLWI